MRSWVQYLFQSKEGKDEYAFNCHVGNCALAISLALASMSWAANAPATLKVPQGWKFTLPDGDAKAGRSVFLEMKCPHDMPASVRN